MDSKTKQKRINILMNKAKVTTLAEAEKLELHLLFKTKTDDTKKDNVKPTMGAVNQ